MKKYLLLLGTVGTLWMNSAVASEGLTVTEAQEEAERVGVKVSDLDRFQSQYGPTSVDGVISYALSMASNPRNDATVEVLRREIENHTEILARADFHSDVFISFFEIFATKNPEAAAKLAVSVAAGLSPDLKATYEEALSDAVSKNTEISKGTLEKMRTNSTLPSMSELHFLRETGKLPDGETASYLRKNMVHQIVPPRP